MTEMSAHRLLNAMIAYHVATSRTTDDEISRAHREGMQEALIHAASVVWDVEYDQAVERVGEMIEDSRAAMAD